MTQSTTSTTTAGPALSDYLQFAALPIIWGSSFLFIKVALGGLSPVQVAWGRAVLGGTTLVLIALVTRRRWPRDRGLWLEMVPVSLLLTVAPFFLISWGGQFIGSGLMSIFNATTPLWTMLIAIAALPQERPTGRKYVALALGFVGVLVLLNPWSITGASSLLGQVASLGAAACYGAGYVMLRRVIAKHDISPITLAAMQVGIGGLLFVLATPWVAMTRRPELTPSVVVCILLLGCIGTGVAYILNNNVVRSMGATTASMVTYLNPIVGVTLGVIVLAESVHWNEPLGALLVIGGILLGQQGATPRPRTAPQAAED
ncbi:DMT family transporter [Cumulibacter manganitolerans]|uniref:DMT family transporter n=1 Tax=Cumulibacter manganitolerans TaxID=1884992 RepID=UPI001295F090|nr:DMT family transporter [Cumulibacter manganitolerans]